MMKEEQPEEPAQGLRDPWEAQSQESLKTPGPVHSGEESPVASEPDPWADPKAFLASFERVAKACQWPKAEWVTQLLPALSGVAEEAFETLELVAREDYEKVKAAILEAHAVKKPIPFGPFSGQGAEDPQNFHCQLQELWHRWLKPARSSKEQILEQFLASLPLHLQSWIRAEGQDTCSQAVALAEDFLVNQQMAQRRKWQVRVFLGAVSELEKERPIKEERSDSRLVDEDFCGAGRMQTYKDAERSSHKPGKGSRVKSESDQRGEKETEDDPRVSRQMKGRTTLDRARMDEERCEPIEEAEKQSVAREDRGLRPPEADSKGGMLWFSKRSRSYHCTLQLDVFDSQDDREERAHDAKEAFQLDPYSQKQPHVVRAKKTAGSSENGQGVISARRRLQQSEEKSAEKSDRGNKLSATESLQRNESVGSEEGLYECPHCRKRFSEREHLVSHEQLHVGKKSPECPTSGKIFPLRQTILRQPGSNTGEKTDKCSQCGKWFCGRENLKRHQRIHTGERRYKCPDCGKSCSQSGHLKLHQRVHTGEKPYKCVWCGKDFADGGNLRKHERIHTGEKPYKCSWCGRCFTDGGTLKQHERIHTGEKPYKCSLCGKCFSERGTLKQHHRIHTGEKPYGCPDCDKKFRKKGDLLRHQRVHTQEK